MSAPRKVKSCVRFRNQLASHPKIPTFIKMLKDAGYFATDTDDFGLNYALKCVVTDALPDVIYKMAQVNHLDLDSINILYEPVMFDGWWLTEKGLVDIAEYQDKQEFRAELDDLAEAIDELAGDVR